jgi:hypothetical protein
MKLICVALQAIVPEGFISGTGVAQYLRQRVSPCNLQGDTWGLTGPACTEAMNEAEEAERRERAEDSAGGVRVERRVRRLAGHVSE